MILSPAKFLSAGCLLAAVVHATEPSNQIRAEKHATLESSIASFSPEDAALFGFPTSRSPAAVTCKTFPTDEAWPSQSEWDRLNATTNGALIKTVPIAAPCYTGSSSDTAKCSSVAAQWGTSNLQYDHSIPSHLNVASGRLTWW